MKKGILIIGFIIGCTLSSFAQTSNSNTPSDQTNNARSQESKTLELIAIFNDAIDAPTKYNEYVKPYIQETTFPKKNSLSKASYDILLREWINKNDDEVIKLLADRKVAHDSLYGSRKK